MPPFCFSLGYLLAVPLHCAAWAYSLGVAHVRLFERIDASPMMIGAISTLGAAALLGLATFVKSAREIPEGRAVYVGRAICVCSIIIWPISMARTGYEVGAFCSALISLGGIAALSRVMRVEAAEDLWGVYNEMLLVVAFVGLFCGGIPYFLGIAVACAVLAFRLIRLWRKRTIAVAGNLGELFIAAALFAIPLGLTTSALRAAHPLYSPGAVIVPLDEWNGSLTIDQWYFDVWIEYPKTALYEEEQAWFAGRHDNAHFYKKVAPDLSPCIAVDGTNKVRLDRSLTLVSDTGEWLGESLDSVHAGERTRSVLFMDKTAARKLGRLGARIVVDFPTLERPKRK